MFDVLLPVLVMLVPVLAIVVLAVAFGRRLSGSCGGVSEDGTCRRCGRTSEEIQQAKSQGVPDNACS